MKLESPILVQGGVGSNVCVGSWMAISLDTFIVSLSSLLML